MNVFERGMEASIAPRKGKQIVRNARLNSVVTLAFISITKLTLVRKIISSRIDSYDALINDEFRRAPASFRALA